MIDKVIGSYLSLFIDGYFFLFFGLSTKNKKRSNLCELCASAVKCLTAQVEKTRAEEGSKGLRVEESKTGCLKCLTVQMI